MSRVGRKPITISPEVSCDIQKNLVIIKGPKGQLEISYPAEIKVFVEEDKLQVGLVDKKAKNLHGLFRSLIANAVMGVTKGWSKELKLVGVGYRAQASGNKLTLHLGFAHPVKIEAPTTITFEAKGNNITVSGIDKQLVGEIAAQVRKVKKPEPYKGKGIRYKDEVVRRKAGKAAKAAGAAGGK